MPQTGEKIEPRPNLISYRELQKFTDREGISNNRINSILQDSRGFLWVSTYDGLNRYDGYQFTKYYSNPDDERSISHNISRSIMETRSGDLWIGTYNGLNRYNRLEDNFKRFVHDPKNSESYPAGESSGMLEDSEGNIWFGTGGGGLSKYNKDTETFTRFVHNPQDSTSISSDIVGAIIEIGKGELWVSTGVGLNKFNTRTNEFSLLPHGKEVINGKLQYSVSSILVDSSGMVWLGKDLSLEKLDPKTNQTTQYYLDATTDNITDYYIDRSNFRAPNQRKVYSLYASKSGRIWVGMNGKFCLYEPELDSFTIYKNDPIRSRNAEFDYVTTLFEDDSEQLWIGTSFTNLVKYNLKMMRFEQFRHNSNIPGSLSGKAINNIFEDRFGIVWVATFDDKLNRYDSKTRRFEVTNVVGNVRVSFMFDDSKGVRWFTTFRGDIYYFDKAKNKFIKFRSSNDVNPSSNTNIQKILEDRDGFLWFSTSKGLYKLNRESKKMTAYLHNPAKPNSLNNNRIHETIIDDDGIFWIATDLGFNRFDPKKEHFTHYVHDPNNTNSVSENLVYCLHKDKAGYLWAGTFFQGLNRFDPRTNTFKRYTEADGMPRAAIFGFLEDDDGNLWVSSNKGLIFMNHQTGNIQNFKVEDGLTDDEFNEDVQFKNKKGEMYFGGIDGYVKFNPKDFAISQFKPPVQITNIRVLEKPYQTNQNVSEMKEINLSWRDYVVSFDFATLDFSNARKLNYQWKLEGFDENWINGEYRRTATYSNLPGGSYSLKVRATNSDGVWGDELIKLKVNISPPFYRTIWFYCLLALLIGGLVWLIYRYRVRQLERLHETQVDFSRLLIKSQEAERKRIASELHDGLAQNLFVIKNLAGIIAKHITVGKTANAIEELRQISDSSTSAIAEVREITHNLRPPMLERLGLTNTIENMISHLSSVIKIESEIDSIDYIFDENDEIGFYRILQESFNNILKHAKASNVKVRVRRRPNQIFTEIIDDGVGFDVEKMRIVKSGLGLSSLKERTQLLNGTFQIDSKVGKGTTIRIAIPIEK